ncbi:hypothetical protein LTSESEN_5323 [Salmonella enterica subsp. enterica serovar Senftenberg str. A4-543]|uniref:Uncharacterized protein n=1 Tax=Salmonella enterica subsp. enterica serovar Senftenberg str. A4-543 TaxID=913082 RepID=G5R6K5_SALSE|nr:hypothetical protein LTSESEN_5323 [Salmonella enterica subsp. enterica serovar Senftenberg str. A4-543]
MKKNLVKSDLDMKNSSAEKNTPFQEPVVMFSGQAHYLRG